MAAAEIKASTSESTERQRTVSFSEEVNEKEFSEEEPQRFHRGGRYLTLPIKAERPEQLLRDIDIGPKPRLKRTDRESKLDTLMSYIRAFSNTIEYELYGRDRWKNVIESRFRAMLDGLKALGHFEDPDFR